MQNLFSKIAMANRRPCISLAIFQNRLPRIIAIGLVAAAPAIGTCADASDPVLNLLLEKGVITEQEAQTAKAQADAIRTNYYAAMPPMDSKWKISKAIENVELFGDIRLRYEQREAKTPTVAKLKLERGRYSVRIGLRGKAFDDFYYGLRADTSSNPRSAWNTFGTSSSSTVPPYHGPYGKSTAGINIGQVYIGWRPADWADLTVGKMANPLYTTAMVWDPDLTPEGAAERFTHNVGPAEFFATFGQFLYQDTNPNHASGAFPTTVPSAQRTDNIFQLAWQGGLTYHFTTNISAKAAATLYQYIGLQSSVSAPVGQSLVPYFGDAYVGEGAYLGGIGGASDINGSSGYAAPGFNPQGFPYYSFGFPNNQVGINHLLVVEIPFEVNFKFTKFDLRLFGDFAYNLDGTRRAEEAAAAYNYYLDYGAGTSGSSPIARLRAQRQDVRAYQFGLALAGKDSLGLVSGSTCRKHAWEVRTYWQHIEQYALDPNLLDSDFFEGRGNLEGLYTAVAYGFTDNVLGTIRYGYANRINDKLGTGGSNQDIPQVNPIDSYNILQMDLTFKF